ncbi:MAG: cytochrome c-type biogenesis protein [Methylococcaceae bacterium]
MKCIIFLLLLAASLSTVAVEIREFADPTQQQHYENLIEDLRCLVCQNQSLADSDADLAKDLRDEVYHIIQSGQTEQEAIRFLTDRYGDFVLYRHPFKPITALLWLGPFLLLLGAAGFLSRHAKRRASTTPSDLSATEKKRLEQLQRETEQERSAH